MLIIGYGCQVTSEIVEWGEEEEDSPIESYVTKKGLIHCLIISSKQNTQTFLNKFKFLKCWDKWSMFTQDYTSWSKGVYEASIIWNMMS